MRSGLLSKAKTALIRGGCRTYILTFGRYSGLKFELDLRYNLQVLMGLWELETHRYLEEWSDYEWIIDVGAGKGELCLFMLKRKPRIKKIVAIEPNNDEVQR